MNLRVFREDLRHYWNIWKRVAKGSMKRGYFYKQDMIVRFVRSFHVLFAQMILLNVVFSNVNLYVGWSKSEAFLVMGIWNLINYLGWSLFGINLIHLEGKVLDGSFDYILLKPVPTYLLSSFGDFFLYDLITAISGVILIFHYLILNYSSLSILNVLFGFLSICVGVFLWYCISLIFASFTISSPRNGLLSVSKEILGVTKYPIDIFGSTLSFLFYVLTPIAFLTTVPAKFFMGGISPFYLIYGLIFGIVMFVVARFLWKWNIGKYESASS